MTVDETAAPGAVESYRATDPSQLFTEELRALGFDPKKPAHRAAVRIAERYGLDPLAKELIVIDGKGAYVTRDGLLAIAHRSGVLDGITIDAEGEDDAQWWAVCSVYRRDMAHPFTYRGRYPHNGSNKNYGPEMAVARAESMALRRAFRWTATPVAEEVHEAEPWAAAELDEGDD